MANDKLIELSFGVSVNDTSTNIATDIANIIKKLEDDGKFKIKFSCAEITDTDNFVKKIADDLADAISKKLANIKLPTGGGNGGGGGRGGGSGNGSKLGGYYRSMREYYADARATIRRDAKSGRTTLFQNGYIQNDNSVLATQANDALKSSELILSKITLSKKEQERKNEELLRQDREIAKEQERAADAIQKQTDAQKEQSEKDDRAEKWANVVSSVNEYYSNLTKIRRELGYGAGFTEQNGKVVGGSGALVNQTNASKDEMDAAIAAYRALNLSKQESADLDDLLAKKDKALAQATEASAKRGASSWDKTSQKVAEFIARQTAAQRDPTARDMAANLQAYMSGAEHNVDELNKRLAEYQKYLRDNGLLTESFGQKLKKTFMGTLRQSLSSLALNTLNMVGIRELYRHVVELDDAVANLQIASGKSRKEVQGMIDDYSRLAKKLGATTQEVAESADTWLRQGYSVEETNEMIRDSTILSKLGQLDAAEAATALTSAVKGYKVEASDALSVVDKLTAVDMEAAASAGGIAKAMSETAASANFAGVSMDRLIGYIATVKEVTQDADESVGTFYKTLFARMGAVKAGKSTDAEGEDISNVESVLGRYGISLRENGVFRDFGDVLDDIARKWDKLDNVQQHQIATVVAATRQQEKFLVLMQNYDAALEYASVAENSRGTAMEKYGAYTDTITAKINSLKSAISDLARTLIDSDFVGDLIDISRTAIEVLNWGSKILGGFIPKLAAALAIVAGFRKWFNSAGFFATLVRTFFTNLINPANGAVSALDRLKEGWTSVVTTMKEHPVASVAGGIAAVAAAVWAVISAMRQAREERIRNALDSSRKSIDEAKAISDNVKSLDDLIARYKGVEAARVGDRTKGQLEEVKSIQTDINELIGEQAKGIDVVNGKYGDQIAVLEALRKKKLEEEIIPAANTAVTSAINAIVNATSGFSLFSKEYTYRPSRIVNSKDYVDLVERLIDESGVATKHVSGGIGTRALETEFSDYNEFVENYEKVLSLYKKISQDETHVGTHFYNAISEYVKDYGELYQNYVTATSDLAKYQSELAKIIAGKDNSAALVLKSTLDILEALEGPYDALTAAIKAFNEQGYISSENFKPLLDAYPQLAQYLYETEYGYTITADALERYLELQRDEIIATYLSSKATSDEATALKNLQRFLLVENTLRRKTVASEKADTSALNAQKDALKDQLDAYKDLVDYRKKLLKTYQDELDYQRELEKKQKNVATLQQKLAIAQLDNSEAGRKRARELSADLASAQEDLDDFTLDHAIEVLTNDLDMQYEEYKNMIDGEIDRVENAISALKDSNASTVSAATISLEQALADYEARQNTKQLAAQKAAERKSNHYDDKASKYANSWLEENVFDADISAEQEKKNIEAAYNALTNGNVDYSKRPYVSRKAMIDAGWRDFDGSFATTYTSGFNRNGLSFDITPIRENGEVLGPSALKWYMSLLDFSHGVEGLIASDAKQMNLIVHAMEGTWEQNEELWSALEEKLSRLKDRHAELFGADNIFEYHSGGIVGNISAIKGNEEFAKLMKGEYVSTPSQIKRFMDYTLPQMSSIAASAGGNEFNAPLVSIECGTVTQDALPGLKTIVDEAVTEVKRQLDSGMSRVGYKPTVKKFIN